MTTSQNNREFVVTEDDVTSIVAKYGYSSKDVVTYEVKNASGDDKVLGFLAEYWNLKITINANGEKTPLCFFIKRLPRTNESKATIIQEVGVHQRELVYYQFVNSDLQVLNLKPWSAKFVTTLNDAMVMEDLAALQYKMRNKYERFDKEHALLGLKTLARFHASSIIYEEKRSKELKRPYRITEDHTEYLDTLFFTKSNDWFIQCKHGSLQAVKALSKYSRDVGSLKIIENRWNDFWDEALDLPLEERCVISHRDLWNNNILFRYKKLNDDTMIPDDCVLVDFQMLSYQPPQADVMLFLHANLDRQDRKENLTMFLNYYYDELKTCLSDNAVDIEKIITRDNFMNVAKKCNQWGLITFACLVPFFWPEDSVILEMFSDSERFDDIVSKHRGNFIIKMVLRSDSYRKTVMGIFEEIADTYILHI